MREGAHRGRLRLGFLADHPEAVPTLAEWFEAEWGAHYGPTGPGDARRDLLARANRDALPVALVAWWEGELGGTAALEAESVPTPSRLGPWIAAGLVRPALRGRGVGTELVRSLEELARGMGHARVYCGTSAAGGILARRGWRLRERVRHGGGVVPVYRKTL